MKRMLVILAAICAGCAGGGGGPMTAAGPGTVKITALGSHDGDL